MCDIMEKLKNVSLDGHPGQQSVDDGQVYFYGLLFEDITEAAKYLKHVPNTHSEYKGKYCKGHKIICDMKSRLVYFKGCSFIDMDHFKDFVRKNS